ncbi:MAG: PQQ-dependent sugar dehydrogenase [Pyrinomonadaceae bacterium]|nr:PQQ-dependent sugar dehydrogenase [Pyrinomonadaceae bacterium]
MRQSSRLLFRVCRFALEHFEKASEGREIKVLRPSEAGSVLFNVLLGSVAVLLLSTHCSLHAATLPSGFTETLVAGNLANPTAMAFAPDGRLFVCQQEGQLRVIKDGQLLATPFLTVTVSAVGERGLLGLAFAPDFAASSTKYVYIYYTATSPTIHNRVSRFRAAGDVAVAGSEEVILELDNLTGATNHNGGAMHFGEDGKLYIAVGENATAANAQTLGNLLGKMLRINGDGTLPTDNPYYTQASGRNRAIWAVGLRNPFTFAFQPGTQRMFINDVGQSTWEEINDGRAGANYGWPNSEGPTTNSAHQGPLYYYSRGDGCAITGGAFYNPAATQFPSEYVGSYFFADFCSGWIRRLDPASGNAVTGFATGIAAPVDLQVGADGGLYYLARGAGAVYRIHYRAETTLQFSAPNYSASESAGGIQITVTRSGDASVAASVSYATDDSTTVLNCATDTTGIASPRCDYATSLDTLSFAPGEVTKTFTIPIVDDAHVEAAEVFTVSLKNPAGATLGTTGTAQLTIINNDTAQSPTNPPVNPIDNSTLFVRQHYIDFLSREPEPAGLDAWLTVLNRCGGGGPGSDPACDRTEVSAAFLRSDEFQFKGYFVYRFYKATLGRLPRYVEIIPDMRRLAGVTGDEVIARRDAFASEWVERAVFKAMYDGLPNAAFVDKLLTTARVQLSNRDALINDLNSGAKTRAQVVRAIVESPEVNAREYNGAFVAMQYFGYLRRDPETEGFDAWLGVIERNPADYRTMVHGFVTSVEYRLRFGQP